MNLDRRTFLAVATGLPLASCQRSSPIPGEILGADAGLGHRLRDGQLPAPVREVSTRVVVVGGGISGLAAARRLNHLGIHEFVILELDRETGGNSSSGANGICAYPWGAHYVPIPGKETTEVLKLFLELGVILGVDPGGKPIYREEYLCHDPVERLYIHGAWQEGLMPQTGITPEEARQIEGFLAEMNRLKNAYGSDGRPVFAIPMEASTRDPSFLQWDRCSMGAWMKERGYTSAPLWWYVNFCCRDDFGAPIDNVSAWAGVHYFASRRGEAANAPSYSVVTWPEGNGWLVNRLRESIADRIHCRTAAWRIENTDAGVHVDAYDAARDESVRYRAEYVIFAAPRFVARRVVRGLAAEPTPTYSPWMVANLSLREIPKGRGAPASWDNAFYESRSLGYVLATHQHLDPYPRETVATYYWPLDHVEPSAARLEALNRTHAEWCSLIVDELEQVAPGIGKSISRIDVKVWGHGMVVPEPGYLWGGAREGLAKSLGRIYFAHSDMSGISLFEEAYTRGVTAADQVAGRLS